MARKRKTRKRHKKGGYDETNRPSPEERAAFRNNISLNRYRHFVRQFNRLSFSTEENSDGPSLRQEETIDQFITRRLGEERQEEDRRTARRREAELRQRANRVSNFLPENINPSFATLQEVQDAEERAEEKAEEKAEEIRLKASEDTRSVYVPVENPDGSIQMGRAVLPTIEEAQRLRNEMAEIPVTRPSRLRRMKEIAGRVKEFLVERTRAIRNRSFFRTRRRNNAIVPMGGEGKRKTRKRKNKKKRTRRVKRRRKRRKKKSKKVRRK